MQSWGGTDTAESQDLDDELQVITKVYYCKALQPACKFTNYNTILQWLQRVASQLEQQSGLLPLSPETTEVFALANNWQNCANDLNSSLAGN